MKKSSNKKRILIIAYAFSPILGSEYRQPWELCSKIAEQFDVTLLFGDSDGLMGTFSTFDQFPEKDDLNYKIIKVPSSALMMALAKVTLKMPFALLFPILLKLWHRKAYKIAKQLHDSNPFDVAHQLGPIGFRNPGYIWKLSCKTYWGPIGGAQYINRKMITRKWSKYSLEAFVRNISVRAQYLSPYISNAARNFDELSFATLENRDYFQLHFDRKGSIISDQGLNVGATFDSKKKAKHDNMKVAWAGSLTPRKNVSALLEIIKATPKEIEFNIMGDGPMKSALMKLAIDYPNIVFHGRLKREDVQRILRGCDVILLTSLSEANTAILFEGIENGCIPVAPNINGFASVINSDVGRLIDQFDFKQYVDETVQALIDLQDYDKRGEIHLALREHLSTLSWQALSLAHTQHYN